MWSFNQMLRSEIHRPGDFLVCWGSHEGLGRRPVREAWERAGGFLDAAGHSQGVGAQRRGHWQVSELGVKVPQVCGAALPSQAGRMVLD